MRQKLFNVNDRFEISNRGTVIVGNLPAIAPDFKLGSPIVLVTPEGREITTEIGGIDYPSGDGNVSLIAVLIKNISKDEIPDGTEVFLEV